MNNAEIKALTEALKSKLESARIYPTKIRFDREEECWNVWHEEGEFDDRDSYYLTVDGDFLLGCTIKVEI